MIIEINLKKKVITRVTFCKKLLILLPPKYHHDSITLKVILKNSKRNLLLNLREKIRTEWTEKKKKNGLQSNTHHPLPHYYNIILISLIGECLFLIDK